MEHNIDLKNYEIRTDLLVETIENNKDDFNVEEEMYKKVKISRVEVDDLNSKKIGKKKGNYITIEFSDITDFSNREDVGKALEKELELILKLNNISKNDSCLVIGLGNSKSTPDSLGPKAIESILITRHLFLLTTPKDGIRSVCAITPGVMGNTGIETSDIINNLISSIKPNFIIVIDALAASSIDRVNKTIQITDSGISPGSGVGNTRKELSSDIFNIPVIAIGVPTVVDAATIVSDTLTYLFKHLSYIKDNFKENKLIVNRYNYLDKIKDKNLNDTEKKEVSGLIGLLSESDKKRLIKEVLTSIDYDLMVTPKEIDFLIDKLSGVISGAINNSLHDSATHY